MYTLHRRLSLIGEKTSVELVSSYYILMLPGSLRYATIWCRALGPALNHMRVPLHSMDSRCTLFCIMNFRLMQLMKNIRAAQKDTRAQNISEHMPCNCRVDLTTTRIASHTHSSVLNLPRREIAPKLYKSLALESWNLM